jgi:hypothetical protein
MICAHVAWKITREPKLNLKQLNLNAIKLFRNAGIAVGRGGLSAVDNALTALPMAVVDSAVHLLIIRMVLTVHHVLIVVLHMDLTTPPHMDHRTDHFLMGPRTARFLMGLLTDHFLMGLLTDHFLMDHRIATIRSDT